MIKRDIRIFGLTRRKKYDLLIGTDPSLAHIGFIRRIPVITVLEDDFKVVPFLARTTFPFTTTILTPEVCNIGRYTRKKAGYKGYMKLGYLHPSVFQADHNKIGFDESFVIIRLTKHSAHHDFGITGLNISLVRKIITEVLKTGRKILISSEAKIEDTILKDYSLNVNPSDIHHFLSFADLLISDSQSMSVEAAMLGTPSIRISDFVGRISVLEELEHKYNLTFGIKPDENDKVLTKLTELLNFPDRKNVFQIRRNNMLDDKINVTDFMVWFLESYPQSIKIIKENPDYQNRFSQAGVSSQVIAEKDACLISDNSFYSKNFSRDFTISLYNNLIQALQKNGYEFQTLKDFIVQPKQKASMLRHDVDELPYNSLKTAQIEYKSGIKSSYFFRIIPRSLNETVLKEIAEMGHEIGYHYEDLTLCKGDIDKAYDSFCRNLEKLRKLYPVKTICMHGSPLSRWDSKDIWRKYDYKKLGIIAEPYFDIDFSKVFYLTDTGRCWDGQRFNIRDKITTSFNLSFHSTKDIIHAITTKKLPDQIMFTIHPQRWSNKPLPWIKELLAQNIKNIIKSTFVSKE
jgi:predicted glycosyltransferase